MCACVMILTEMEKQGLCLRVGDLVGEDSKILSVCGVGGFPFKESCLTSLYGWLSLVAPIDSFLDFVDSLYIWFSWFFCALGLLCLRFLSSIYV